MSMTRKVRCLAGAAFLWSGLAVPTAGIATLLTSYFGVISPFRAQAQVRPSSANVDIGVPSRPLTEERAVRTNPIAEDYKVGALQRDFTGSLWVGSRQGLSRIDPETGRVMATVAIPNRFIDSMAQDKVGRIWLGTPEGLIRVEPRINEVTSQNFRLPSNRVLDTLIDQRGFLWVGTDRGLVMISPDEGLLMTTVQALPGVSANTLGLAPDGNLWVGT